MVFVEGCKHPKSITLLLRGGSQRVVDEVERSVHDALMVVKDVIENPLIVAGGGARNLCSNKTPQLGKIAGVENNLQQRNLLIH